MIHEPKQFKLNEGVDTYNPDVVADILVFFFLNNIEPRLGRLFASKGYSIFQDLELETGDKIVSFGYYQLANRKFYNLYAFSKTSVYWFNFETELFEVTPIYEGFFDSSDPYVIIQWYDCLYVTKLQSPYVKIERKLVTPIEGAPYARYGIIATGHVFLGAVGDFLDNELAMFRWSDRDSPEDFVVNPNESEADFFQLEPDSRQITGLSYQRGSPVSYSENCIWIAQDIGFPGGFRFEPLIPGIGNIFHNAVVRAGEVDFFIAQDDIYMLNGLQLVSIGEPIFQRFINNIKIVANMSVRGYLDTRKTQVFWVYTRTDDSLWSIVYNYKEKKWSEREPQGITAWMDTPLVAMSGYKVIDDYTEFPDDVDDVIDDPNEGFPVVFKPFAAADGVILKSDDAVLKADETSFDHRIETFDFYFATFGQVNEITKALLEYVGTGEPDIQLSIGTRPNQSAPIAWSTPKSLDRDTDSSLNFFIRAIGVGKYIRFRFEWSNEEDDNVDDLRLLSLIKVEDQVDGAPEE